MAFVTSPNLILTTVGQNVTINVTYNANFPPFERFLHANGLTSHEHVEVQGMDPAGSLTGTTIRSFPLANLPVTAGGTTQVIGRNLSMTVTRAVLQEDIGLGDADEIRAKIRIHTVGIPAEFSFDSFTPEQVLLG